MLKLNSLFPQGLESSGYIILATLSLIFSLLFLIQALLYQKLLVSLKEGNKNLNNVAFSLYIQQQITEYRLLLADLTYSQGAVEKANARTHLYNYLNTTCLEICENPNKYLASQLAQVFFSKIQSRYLKLVSVPDGLIYFKYVSGILLAHPSNSITDNLQKIRKNFKKEIKFQQDIQREVIPTDDPKKSKFFSFFKKESKEVKK
ncbi:MAG: hypothetical protein ACRCWI_04840 [Brevinema sp.]